MASASPRFGRFLRSDRYVLPIGSSWERTEIDPKKIAGYRFFSPPVELRLYPKPTRYARLKTRLDALAAIYCALALVGVFIGNSPQGGPVIAWITRIAHAFALRPLVPTSLQHTRLGGAIPFLVFVIAIFCVLLHESRWLALQIYLQKLVPGWFDREPRFSPRQQVLTIASKTINHVVLLGIVAMGTDYLWNLRLISWARSPLEIPAVTFLGILLTVMGVADAVSALQRDDAAPLLRVLEITVGSVLTGMSFAIVLGLGPKPGVSGAVIGLCFGGTMALSAWIFRYFIVRPRQKQLPPRLQPVIRYAVFVPLIALGRILDAILAVFLKYVVSPLQKSLYALFRPLLEWLVSVLRKMPHKMVHRPLDWARSYLYEPQPISPVEMRDTFQPAGRTADGQTYGYLYRAKQPLPPIGFLHYVRSSLLQGLVAEDSWLTLWLKREPIRPLAGTRNGAWEREDPLDFKRKVRIVFGFWPPVDDIDRLYRRLLSLMLATYLVATVCELVVGHVIAFSGRPLLDRGAVFALLFGVGVGVVFAVIGILGHSSISVLTLGLVSGLSLDPMLGLGGGLVYRLVHSGLLLLAAFALSRLTDTLQRRALFAAGLLIAAAGAYLQYLPFLIQR